MKKKVTIVAVLLLCLLFLFSSNLVIATQTYLNESDAWESNISEIYYSTIASGDFDGDGDSDLVTIGNCGSGCYRSKAYTNNGTGFSYNLSLSQNLTNMHYGSLALGDIDNDGDLDLILTGCIWGGSYTGLCEGFTEAKIYLYNGTGFEENQSWQANLTKVWRSSLEFADIDNDGDLDLILTGDTGAGMTSKIYLNNGTSFLENQTWTQNLTNIRDSAVALGDIDNDGDLDLAMSGRKGSTKFSRIYVNNGTSFEENMIWSQSLTYVKDSSITIGDFDNDGDLDLSLIGCCDEHRIYRNNGSTFIEIQREVEELDGMFAGSQSLGDYDNDGYLDLITTGRESSTVLYLFNASRNNFTGYWQDPESHIRSMRYSYVLWIDMDNDTDLDLVLSGFGADIERFVYTSNLSLTKNNTLPAPPNSSLSENYANDKLTLSWGNGSDNETPTAGLYYNLRVGNCLGCQNIVTGIFGGGDDNGYFGNMMQRKSITLHGNWLQANTTYYWSVQTIDTGLAKSAWSEEQNYTTAEEEIISPNIVLNEPVDSNYTSFDNVTFNATVWDNVNVSNVSLHGSWGGWHRNQTNSSGLNGTDYLFHVNFSGYPEGTYTWAIHSCDTSGNCRYSGNRTVIRDLSNPLIMIEYPANESTWTASNTLNFTFNVTDLAIQNCRLIIGSSLKYNLTSVNINTSTNITLDLANGNYFWYVNCTDMLQRQNASARRQLTVNYQAPSQPSAPSGGGGGGIPSKTYDIGKLQEAQEINQALRKGDKIKFNLTGKEHQLEVKKVMSNSVLIELNSTPFNFTLSINESKKLNLSSYDFYELFIKLNSIINFKANLTLRAIHEAIPFAEPPEQENATKEEIEKEQKEPVETGEEEAARNYWWIGSGLASIAVIAGLITWLKKKKIK